MPDADPVASPAAPPAPRRRTMVVIPAFNEGASIADVVAGARRALPGATVVVVDDGSADGTAAAARDAGGEVLRLPFNCGIGVAVQAGLRFATGEGAELVVRIDGDGQHDPAEIGKLIAAVERGADCTVGSRFLAPASRAYRSSFGRRLGIRWFASILHVVGAGAVTDPTSGFFAVNAGAARFLAAHYASDYPEVDAVVRLARSGFRLAEVPVAMRERAGGISSIGGLAALVYMVRVTAAIVVSWLDTLRRRRSAPHG